VSAQAPAPTAPRPVSVLAEPGLGCRDATALRIARHGVAFFSGHCIVRIALLLRRIGLDLANFLRGFCIDQRPGLDRLGLLHAHILGIARQVIAFFLGQCVVGLRAHLEQLQLVCRFSGVAVLEFGQRNILLAVGIDLADILGVVLQFGASGLVDLVLGADAGLGALWSALDMVADCAAAAAIMAAMISEVWSVDCSFMMLFQG